MTFIQISMTLLAAAVLVSCVAPQSRIARASDAEIEAEAQAQREVAVKTIIDRQRRLWNAAHPIWKANAELCGQDVAPSIGAIIQNTATFESGDLTDTFRRALHLEDRPKVTHIVPGSPAEGNLQVGDVILEVEGKPVLSGATALADIRSAVSKAMPGLPMRMRLERGGSPIDKGLVPVQSCAYPVHYDPSHAINAYADGSAVYVTAGMMRFVENDQELAVVLGHELAHNAQGHIDAKKVNVGIGLIFDILAAGAGVNTRGAFSEAGARSYSQDFESEADYVGIYYLARAGMAIDQAPYFWRRMAAENPGSIPGSYQNSHPSSAQRFIQLDKAMQEIGLKGARGESLMPNSLQQKESSGDASTETGPAEPSRPAVQQAPAKNVLLR